jgi:hypothetical protein
MPTTDATSPGTATRRPADLPASPYRGVAIVAAASVLLVGFDYSLRPGLKLGLVVAALMLPLWWSAVRSYVLAMPIVLLAGAAVVSGVVLSELAKVDRPVDASNRVLMISVLLSGVAAFVLVLWARSLVPLHDVVLLYGLGGVLSAASSGRFDWKVDLALPVTFLALGLAERSRRRWIPVVVVLGLGVAGALNEGRSYFAFCLLAAVLSLWQLRPSRDGGTGRPWMTAGLLGLSVLAVYSLATTLLTRGVFGTVLQQRSLDQMGATGSLIAGGRPEWAATRELVKLRPQGYGAGVVPTWADLEAGVSGLASIDIDTGGYANNYMFGGRFNLHSVTADLWVNFGWVGVLLAATCLALVLGATVSSLSRRTAPTSVLFASLFAIWLVLFGPLYTDWVFVGVAMGLVALRRPVDEPGAAPELAG